MSLTLTILLALLSAGLLAGRVYEILYLTDAATGFLLVNGIVMNPYILGIFAVITVCCGILIFGSYKKAAPFYSASSKYTAFIAGVSLTVAGVLSLQSEAVAPFFIAGGTALVIMSVAGLGKRKTDILVMLLMLVFAAGMCMDVVSFDVSTYHNTVFLQNVLEYICMAAFLLTLVKNVYMPAKTSRMMLYVTGMLAFAVCSMMNIADIICYVIADGQNLYQMLMYIAAALFGVFAFDTAVSVIPEKNSKENNKTESCKDAVSDSENCDETEDWERFAAAENEKRFENFEENKTPVFMNEANSDIEEDENSLKHTIFSELFGENTEKSISAEEPHSILSETRSFKKFSQPKFDESSPEYDMLKSMFRGEDTSQYQFETTELPKAEKEQKKQNEKHSVFGAGKKNQMQSERNAETETDSKKVKTDTKKIVYKKPK